MLLFLQVRVVVFPIVLSLIQIIASSNGFVSTQYGNRYTRSDHIYSIVHTAV